MAKISYLQLAFSGRIANINKVNIYIFLSFKKKWGLKRGAIQYAHPYYVIYYRVIALISADIVSSFDIEGRELASVRRYPNEGNIRRYQCDNPFIV